ncbi:hypothetical protein NUM3379_06370 [Kineococcus sp. NUM-3379]
MDGINGVMSRIAELDARFGSMRPVSVPAVVTRQIPASAAGGGDFASVLAGAAPAQQQAATAQAAAQPVSSHHLVPRQLVAQQSAAGSTSAGAGTAVGGVMGSTAVTGGGTTGGAAASAPVSGKRNAAGVPVELAAYGNGKIPTGALRSIGVGQHRMWGPAAENFERMNAAAAKDGIRLKVTDSYRTYESQVELAQRKGLYSQGGLAARPGTSEHGWGLSVDIDTSGGAVGWLRAHAKEYGFSENVKREPWHWTYTAR